MADAYAYRFNLCSEVAEDTYSVYSNHSTQLTMIQT